MNVSVISSGGVSNPKANSAVSALKQFKADLLNQLKKVNESKEDSKAKVEKIKQINEQIAEVDNQIQRMLMEERQKEIQETAAKAAERAAEQQQETAAEGSGVILSASLNKVISLQRNMADYQTMGKVRTKLKGEIKIADSQIKNGIPGGSIAYQLAVISGNTDKLSKVEHDMGEQAGKIQSRIKDSIKAGIEEAEKERKAKKENSGKLANKAENNGDNTNPQPTQTSNSTDLLIDERGGGEAKADKKGNSQEETKSMDVVV